MQTELALVDSSVSLALIRLLESADLYTCYTQATQRIIADTVFQDKDLRDLVLNITSSLKLNAGFTNPPIPWQLIISTVASGKSQKSLQSLQGNASLMPFEVSTILNTGEEPNVVMSNNEWYAVFVLLRMWLLDTTSWAQEVIQSRAATPPGK